MSCIEKAESGFFNKAEAIRVKQLKTHLNDHDIVSGLCVSLYKSER